MNKSFDENQTSTCGMCKKRINTNHEFLYCSIYKYKTHPKCNNIDNSNFDKQKILKTFSALNAERKLYPFNR